MADATLYDIIEPAAPLEIAPASVPWLLPAGLLLAVSLLVAWFLHHRRWHRRLRRIAQQPMPEAAYAAAALLQARWALNRLESNAPPPRRGDAQDWCRLVQELDSARYRPEGADVSLPLARVRRWL
jgi:hypothetical protein